MSRFSFLKRYFLTQTHHSFFVLLPILAAIMAEAHIEFLANKLSGADNYLLLNFEYFIACLPLLLAHYLAYQKGKLRGFIIWLIGFVVYPLLREILREVFNSTEFDSLLLNLNNWLFPLVASASWFCANYIQQRQSQFSFPYIYKVFSLNGMLVISFIVWSAITAGVFANVDDPIRNQPLDMVIDFSRIAADLSIYSSYFLQFLLVASCIFVIYFINRYVLIQRMLAQHGLVSFLLSGLVLILLSTPLLSSLVLLLPLNIEEFTLLPSQDHNIFAPDNYRFTFIVLAISTPIILAFERQQQGVTLAQIAEQQVQTELKLLQQQINPHFLFNTLNNLYALALKKSDECPDMVMKLSDLLRFTVYEGQQKQVLLSKEVTYLKNYIDLQKIRWGKQCTLNLIWPANADNWRIEPMLLITLLENAFKYGVEPQTAETEVTFHLTVNNGELHLICTNEVCEFNNDTYSGVGLANLSKRLKLLYPNKYTLTSKQDGKLWKAELKMELAQC